MHDFDAIYRENADLVYRYLFSLSHDADISEDLTQQTFYEAIRSISHYRGNAALSTYLCGIAKNLLKKEFNHRKKCKNVPLDEIENSASHGSVETEILASALRCEIFRKIHLLPERMREVIYLRISGELSFAEIGDILGESETWARVTFYRAKKKLREGGID